MSNLKSLTHSTKMFENFQGKVKAIYSLLVSFKDVQHRRFELKKIVFKKLQVTKINIF